jgi:hypothetical protein
MDQKNAEFRTLYLMNAEQETYVGLFIMAGVWALLSGAVVVLSIREASQRSAWRWAASLAVASLVAAYCLWRLL